VHPESDRHIQTSDGATHALDGYANVSVRFVRSTGRHGEMCLIVMDADNVIGPQHPHLIVVWHKWYIHLANESKVYG